MRKKKEKEKEDKDKDKDKDKEEDLYGYREDDIISFVNDCKHSCRKSMLLSVQSASETTMEHISNRLKLSSVCLIDAAKMHDCLVSIVETKRFHSSTKEFRSAVICYLMKEGLSTMVNVKAFFTNAHDNSLIEYESYWDTPLTWAAWMSFAMLEAFLCLPPRFKVDVNVLGDRNASVLYWWSTRTKSEELKYFSLGVDIINRMNDETLQCFGIDNTVLHFIIFELVNRKAYPRIRQVFDALMKRVEPDGGGAMDLVTTTIPGRGNQSIEPITYMDSILAQDILKASSLSSSFRSQLLSLRDQLYKETEKRRNYPKCLFDALTKAMERSPLSDVADVLKMICSYSPAFHQSKPTVR